MRLLRILLLLLLAAVIGCEEEEEDPIEEQFVGTYKVYDPDVVGEDLDSVILTVDETTRYQLLHYRERSGASIDFCNSVGLVSGFGTNFAVFGPRQIETANCDSVRIPRDTFVSDWQNHGDTIWMDRDDGTLVYELRLMTRRPQPD
jgi:hypothetical protein